jgi:hypothetical protein
VPEVQCDQGIIVTDGQGIFNARAAAHGVNEQERSRCPAKGQVCCLNLPDF